MNTDLLPGSLFYAFHAFRHLAELKNVNTFISLAGEFISQCDGVYLVSMDIRGRGVRFHSKNDGGFSMWALTET